MTQLNKEPLQKMFKCLQTGGTAPQDIADTISRGNLDSDKLKGNRVSDNTAHELANLFGIMI